MSTLPPEEKCENTYGCRNARRLGVTKNGLACLFWANILMFVLCVAAVVTFCVTLCHSPRMNHLGTLVSQRLEASAEEKLTVEKDDLNDLNGEAPPEEPVAAVTPEEPLSSLPPALSDEEALDELFAQYRIVAQMEDEGASDEELGLYLVEESGLAENIPFHMWCLDVAQDESLQPIRIMLIFTVIGVAFCAILALIGIILCACTPDELVPKAAWLVLGAVLLPIVVSNIINAIAPALGIVSSIAAVFAVYWWLLFLRRTAIAIQNEKLEKEAKTLWHSYLYMIVTGICIAILAIPLMMLTVSTYTSAMGILGLLVFLLALVTLYFGLRYAIGSLVILFTLSRAIPTGRRRG